VGATCWKSFYDHDGSTTGQNRRTDRTSYMTVVGRLERTDGRTGWRENDGRNGPKMNRGIG
jgi:hypothetical protein